MAINNKNVNEKVYYYLFIIYLGFPLPQKAMGAQERGPESNE